MGQEPAVCTRIGQQFFLIESLRVFQRLLGGIAENAVGIPLKRGQVIEQRRILFLSLCSTCLTTALSLLQASVRLRASLRS